jgi:peptidyl-prolyl cis-trans isomerase C
MMPRRFAPLIAATCALMLWSGPTARAAAAASGSKPSTKTAKPAKSTAAPKDTSRVLARVGGEKLTVAMVQARIDELPDQYKAQYATPSGRQQVLDRLIEEKVWLASATRHGVPDRPKVKQQMEQQKRDLLIRTWINEQMAGNPAPSDSEARLYYDAHQSEYKSPASATIRQIQFKTEAEAKKVLPMTRDPKQDFAKLAEKYSADTLSKKTGGVLGTVTPDGIFPTLGTQKALAESLFTLEEGKVGGPWQTNLGWHIIKVDQKRAESVRTFEQVRPMIQRQLGTQRTQDYYKTLLDHARHEIGVTEDSVAIRNFVSARRSARDMFKDAQEASSPQDRIDGYRAVLQTWPNSDVAPQAQFMIGFINSEELKNYDAAETAFRALLKNYPKSELAASAQWMVDHMRSEEAPAFITQQAESSQAAARPAGKSTPGAHKSGSSGKP